VSGHYDRNALTGHHAEGNAQYVAGVHAAYGYTDAHGGTPAFARYVILDVIHDPTIIDQKKLDHWVHDLGVANVSAASVAPRNSIVAQRVLGNGATASDKAMVLYPFFPPHLAFPAKPGEHVWVMFEHPDAKVNEVGYWMCRIVGPSFIEDVNHTHMDRAMDTSFSPGTAATHSGNDAPKHEYRNGAAQEHDDERYSPADTVSIPGGDPDAYKKLLTESDASKITQLEAVPRYRKRPGDVTFEGTNNTLIVLGTDRTGAASDYEGDDVTGKVPKKFDNEQHLGAGSIDIVAGRGQTHATAGAVAKNTTTGTEELNKSNRELLAQEGDVDYAHDRSRALVSQAMHVDEHFNLDGIVGAHSTVEVIKDADGVGAIVFKSDRVRLVARKDIVILVTGATEFDDKGKVKEPDADPSKCASIIVRVNGDVIFTPAAKGVVKLGGDDANLAVLCQRATTGAGDGTGNVSAPPTIDTMFGSAGLGGVSGEYATKVLLK
jgi:hypothetical protein